MDGTIVKYDPMIEPLMLLMLISPNVKSRLLLTAASCWRMTAKASVFPKNIIWMEKALQLRQTGYFRNQPADFINEPRQNTEIRQHIKEGHDEDNRQQCAEEKSTVGLAMTDGKAKAIP